MQIALSQMRHAIRSAARLEAKAGFMHTQISHPPTSSCAFSWTLTGTIASRALRERAR